MDDKQKDMTDDYRKFLSTFSRIQQSILKRMISEQQASINQKYDKLLEQINADIETEIRLKKEKAAIIGDTFSLNSPDEETGLPEIMTVDEMRIYLRIGRNKAYELIKTGEIGCVKVGRKILVPKKAIEKFLGKAINP